MNFNRISLKTKAKRILRKNFGWAILVTLIFSFTSFGMGSITSQNQLRDMFRPSTNVSQNNNVNNFDSDVNGIVRFNPYGVIKEARNDVEELIRQFFPYYQGSIWAIVYFIFMLSALTSILLKVFVLNPFQVGCIKWYLRNRTEDRPKMKALVEPFTERYLLTVKTMFLRDLYTFLWSLLLIIPGIVKAYEYRMIPFLIAENPDMSTKEAFRMTRNIMTGNKMDTFVLDLSFIPWILLSALTCGILSIIYVSPYIALTNTELYVCLCQGKEKYESTI